MVELKDRHGRIIWRGGASTVREAVLLAVEAQQSLVYTALPAHTDLSGTNLPKISLWQGHLDDVNFSDAVLSEACFISTRLRGTNFTDADLSKASFFRADLYGAVMSGANLSETNFIGATLSEANLSHANLTNATLKGATLSYADLTGAILVGAHLSSPPMMLLADWGQVSDELCMLLMRYDAANHPNGVAAFSVWARDPTAWECPYTDQKIIRAANFRENAQLWNPNAPVLSAYELMVRLIRERCADSDFH